MLSKFLNKPIPQDLSFHNFADQRKISKFVPNTYDVLSNLPFIIIGLMGFLQSGRLSFTWFTVYFGLVLTGFGSIYYHLDPNNDTLFWDRLPMSLTFMGFLTYVIQNSLGVTNSFSTMILTVLLISLGTYSVFYWRFTEKQEKGDLRPYILTQYGSILAILVLSYFNPGTKNAYVYLPLSFYLLAKICEYYDHLIYEITDNKVSGHTLKHLIAGISTAFLLKLSQ